MASSKDVVAPRDQQPNPIAHWPGHTSQKFTTNKQHTAAPHVPDQYKDDRGRVHFEGQRGSQKDWKPSLVTGITPVSKDPRNQGVKNINFKPIDVKDYHERRHLKPAFDSLAGPTNDNLPIGLRAFEVANKVTEGEYN
jgi:hypothetical protein